MSSFPNFIDRSPNGFVDAICRRIESVMVSFWQETESPDKTYHIPHVHAQYLPVSLTANAERDKSKDYPFVQVVCTEGIISDFHPAANGSEVTIEIYFGGYRNDPDNQGWRIPTAMFWRAMQNLLENKIVEGYLLDSSLEWKQLLSDNPPYYHTKIITKWKGSPPAIEVPFEGVAIPDQGSEEKFEIM